MKVHTTEIEAKSPPAQPAVIALIEFKPWPFRDDTIETRLGYIDDAGDLDRYTEGVGYVLDGTHDRLIAVLEDGTQVVANPRGVLTYMRAWGGVTVPW